MRIFILTIIVFSSLFSFGQKDSNYIAYYNLINEGDHQRYLKNDSLAFDYYQKAFNEVNYVHCHYLIKAAEIAAKIKDYKSTYLYSKQAIIQGDNIKFYKCRVFRKFRKTAYYDNLKDSLDFFLEKSKYTIIDDYKYMVDSLFYIDQVIVRGAKNYDKCNYNIDKSKLPKSLSVVDSLVFIDFLALIDKYGFPTEDKIGYKSFFNVWIFFHHHIRLEENAKYMTLAQNALRCGAYFPKDYAWMYDQSREIKKEQPYFYRGSFDPKDLEIYHDVINKRRKEWGIKPLEASVTRKFLLGTITTNRW